MKNFMTITILIILIIIGVITVLGVICAFIIGYKTNYIPQEYVPNFLKEFTPDDYSFLSYFEEYTIRKSTLFRGEVYINFTLKVGGIGVEKRLEAKSFEELMPKLKKWFDINKEKLDFIDANLEEIN